MYQQLKATMEAASKPLPDWPEDAGKGTHAFVRKQTLPFQMWETSQVFHGEDLVRVEVHAITVHQYDCLPGARAPTVGFSDRQGRSHCRGSVEMFYCTEAAARANAEYVMTFDAREKANADLIRLAQRAMPDLLNAVKTLGLMTKMVKADNLTNDLIEEAEGILRNLSWS